MSHWHAIDATCSSVRFDSPVDCHAAAGAPRTSSTKAQTACTKSEAPRAGPDGRQVRQAAREGAAERRGQARVVGPGPGRVGRRVLRRLMQPSAFSPVCVATGVDPNSYYYSTTGVPIPVR